METDLTERAEVALRQFVITVEGPKGPIQTLSAEDLAIFMGGKPITEFYLDSFCTPETMTAADELLAAEATEAVESSFAAPLNVAFYWDSDMMDMLGFHTSIRTLRGLVPKFIKNGNRGAFVADGITLQPFTTDPDELLAAIDAVESDTRHFNPHWNAECRRWGEVIGSQGGRAARTLRGQSFEALAVRNPLASTYARTEMFMARRSLDRLLGYAISVYEAPQPKILVYFANRLRLGGGEHYFRALSASPPPSGYDVRDHFRRVIGVITAQGVRVYTAMASGLTTPIQDRMNCPRRFPNPRFDGGMSDVASALAGLALETGGDAHLNASGDNPEQIAKTILTDIRCQYLVSFHAELLERERSLGVEVGLSGRLSRARRRELDRVRISSASKLTVESEATKRERSWIAELLNAQESDIGKGVHVGFVPLGYRKGRYKVMVQVVAAPVGFAETTWQMGATLLSGNHPTEMYVSGNAAARIIHDNDRALTVFESTHWIPADRLTQISALVSASPHDEGDENRASIEGDVTLSARTPQTMWPKPNHSGAISPIAVVQEVQAAFSREVKNDADMIEGYRPTDTGALAFGNRHALSSGDRTSLLYLACGPSRSSDLLVKRRLVGTIAYPLEDLNVDLDGELCVFIQDRLAWEDPASGALRHGLREGDYVFEVEVLEKDRKGQPGDQPLVTANRSFRVGSGR